MAEPSDQMWGGGRLVLGFILAPVAPAVLVGLWMGHASAGEDHTGLALPFTLAALVLGGYLPMMTVGLPLFYAMRGLKSARNPLGLAAAGALVAMLPTLLMAAWGAAAGEEDGSMLLTASIPALLGALAGVMFWAISFWSPKGAKVS
jgi:hypothetical protein